MKTLKLVAVLAATALLAACGERTQTGGVDGARIAAAAPATARRMIRRRAQNALAQ